ncbi:TPA: hypothetical protein ACX6NR_002834 [Photobacterium damselae]
MMINKKLTIAEKIVKRIENRKEQYPSKLGSLFILGWLFILSIWNSRVFNSIFWVTSMIFFFQEYDVFWAYLLLLFPFFSALVPVSSLLILNKAFRTGAAQRQKGEYVNPYPSYSKRHEQFKLGYYEKK